LAVVKSIVLHQNISWTRLAAIFLQIPNTSFASPAWFLSSLLLAKLVFALLLKPCKKNLLLPNPVSFSLSFATFLFLQAGMPLLPWDFDVSILTLVSLSVGYTAKHKNFLEILTHGSGASQALLFLLLLITGSGLCYLNSLFGEHNIDYHARHFQEYFTCIFSGLLLIFALLMLAKWIAGKKSMRLIRYIGKNSLIYYLVDWVGVTALNLILSRSGLMTQLPNVIIFILELIMASLIPIPIVWILNRFFPFFIGKSYKLFPFLSKNQKTNETN